MKNKIQILGIVSLLASTTDAPAIENLKLSLQCSNVVLSWPSVPGDIYIIRCRTNLDSAAPWVIVTNWPAAAETNFTVFVHSNVVLHPNCGAGSSFNRGEGGGAGVPMPEVMSATLVGAKYAAFLERLDSLPKPPVPWEQSTKPIHKGLFDFGDNGNGPDGLDSVEAPDMAFYDVTKVGIHLFGITNSMILSEQVPLQIEFGNTDTNSTLIALFLSETNDDSGDLSGVSFTDPAQAVNRLTGVWDTMCLTNGTYTVQLGAMLDNTNFYLDHPVTVTISNVAWFPEPWFVGGGAIYVGMQTILTNGGSWRLDLYDAQHTLLGFLTGPIDSNGYLAYPGVPGPGFSIGNLDAQGNQYPDLFYDLVYTITPPTPPGPQPQILSPPWVITNRTMIELPWNFQPSYATVCDVDVFGNSRPIAQTEQAAMVQAVAAAEAVYHPLTIGSVLAPFRVGMNGQWTNVISLGLQPSICRDFYYFGHGNPTAIGSPTAGILTSKTVSLSLSNNLTTINNIHPYRFVFLDGCQTANGDWPLAFGIGKQKLKIADFLKRGLRPRAFMGWSNKKQVGWINQGVMNGDHEIFIQTFWSKWLSIDPSTTDTFTLKKALEAAAKKEIGSTGVFVDNPQAKGMVVYGAEDLTVWH